MKCEICKHRENCKDYQICEELEEKDGSLLLVKGIISKFCDKYEPEVRIPTVFSKEQIEFFKKLRENRADS